MIAIDPMTSERADYADFYHTGPDTPAGKWFRMFWHPVLRSEDLLPGRATPVRLMSEDFTLYRGETGTAHALGFRCAHRGTQLSTVLKGVKGVELGTSNKFAWDKGSG